LGAVFIANIVIDLIVITFRVKGRIDITKVNRFVSYELSQVVEIVAVKEFIHWDTV
jgi:hypothetical protein